MRRSLLAAAFVITAATNADAQRPDTVRFTPTVGYQTFAVREPVLRIKPNTVLISNTLMGGYYTEAGGAWPGEVGPIYIEGATTNDILVVRIRRVRPNIDLAPAAINTNFGGLNADARSRMINPPIPNRRFLWRLDRQKNTGSLELPNSALKKIDVELKPMLGRVAVAPRGVEQFGGLWPGDFGGNMDAPEIREGATVYLPIFHDGAYFYFGDGHALQGEGEIAGTGLETTMDVVIELDLIKGRRIDWPRIENDTHIMVAGSARPLIDAFRLAHVELIEWLEEDYGFERWEAYQVLAQLSESTVANIVDPSYTVVAKFPKRYLPPKLTQAQSTLGRMAGTWRIDVRPADRDTVLLTHEMRLPVDTSAWKVAFPGREAIRMNVVGVQGDSVRVRFGPYSSALRADIRVLSEGYLRMQGDQLIGNIVARYSVQTPDSVRHLRLRGTKVVEK